MPSALPERLFFPPSTFLPAAAPLFDTRPCLERPVFHGRQLPPRPPMLSTLPKLMSPYIYRLLLLPHSLTPGLASSGQFPLAVSFISRHPEALWNVITLSVSATVGESQRRKGVFEKSCDSGLHRECSSRWAGSHSGRCPCMRTFSISSPLALGALTGIHCVRWMLLAFTCCSGPPLGALCLQLALRAPLVLCTPYGAVCPQLAALVHHAML